MRRIAVLVALLVLGLAAAGTEAAPKPPAPAFVLTYGVELSTQALLDVEGRGEGVVVHYGTADPGTVLLPATQTYSDGEVVRWDEPTPSSGEEPEHPAPALSTPSGATGRTAIRAYAPPVRSTASTRPMTNPFG